MSAEEFDTLSIQRFLNNNSYIYKLLKHILNENDFSDNETNNNDYMLALMTTKFYPVTSCQITEGQLEILLIFLNIQNDGAM